ncbi:hypothetical protein RJ640_020284 [Escallonia rubra]|uniref:3-methyl-2-oxobutanoate hydroxymethyltransferase n=1 Tax=Escallonia rubra TaxID=112253 RepID=A0AA88S5E3_9ASTE|nr:hypothetical protein RJ640_020284 [Escallonia rubra]
MNGDWVVEGGPVGGVVEGGDGSQMVGGWGQRRGRRFGEEWDEIVKGRDRRVIQGNIPEDNVYIGPKPQNHNQRVTLTHMRQKHRKGEPITMVTAYDYPSVVHLHSAGIDICLVEDSASMVVHGHDTTLPITLDEMLVHCCAVARGAKRSLLVGDLPFGTYESSSHQVEFLCVTVLNSWKRAEFIRL